MYLNHRHLARFKNVGGNRLWNVLDMVRACSGDNLRGATVTALFLRSCMPWRNWRKPEIGGDDGGLATQPQPQMNSDVVHGSVAEHPHGRLRSHARQSEEQFGGLLMSSALVCTCLTHILQQTFAPQGISERRLVAASQCLEALDKRLPGMPGS